MYYFAAKINFHLQSLMKALLITINGWGYFYKNIPNEAVIMSISDGIGNQLFKHAFGLSISNKLSKKYFIDTSSFQGDTKYKRSYKLDKIGINTEQICTLNYSNIREYFAFFHYLRMINKLIPFSMRIYINENDTTKKQVDKIFENLNNRKLRTAVYFDGYWQNINYISSSHKIIQAQVLEAWKLSDRANQWLEKIQQKESVSVHIRQIQFSQNLQPSYYVKAYNLIKTIIPDARFYIFADDWQWVEENLSFLSPVELVQGNNDIDDFYLLLYSRNTIIANSTFSWWAAYLKPYEDSKIIAPALFGKTLGIPNKWIEVRDF